MPNSSFNAIDSLQHEDRRFPPSAAFVSQRVAHPDLYDEARRSRLEFWARQARELHWDREFTQTLD